MEESLESASAFAVLTPPGRGGIAVIRCVGPAAETALIRCFRHCGTPALGRATFREDAQPGAAVPHDLPTAGSLAYGHIVDAEDRPLDEVILCHISPLVFEVNCHGGPAPVKAVCERLSQLGLAAVDPDRLMEIEGVPRLVRDARRALRTATTPLAARIILDQLNGALGDAIKNIQLAPGEYTGGRAADSAIAQVDALLDRWRTCGQFIAEPPRIVIAGRPNAGKSTLLNRLVGAERAITSPAPGTTRDYVEAEAALEGVPVTLVDTAGLREAGAGIEREGVERARREAARASVVVYLVDAGDGASAEDEAAIKSLDDRVIVALNKADSTTILSRPPRRPRAAETVSISALTGEGIAALAAAVLERVGYRPTAAGDAVPFTAAQAEALRTARSALAAARTDDARRTLASIIEGP
jgi:tRNA modification GTPase